MSDYRKRANLFALETLEKRTLLSAPGITIGANVNMSQASGNELEDSIAVNPTNSNNIVACSNIETPNYSQIAVYHSSDGGKTWATTVVGANLDGMNSGTQRPDPRVAFDAFGNLYLVYEVGGGNNNIDIVVGQSSNGGASFTEHLAMNSANVNLDYPHIATGVDASNSARQDVWIAFDNETANRVQVVVASSTGSGNLGGFTSPTTISSINDGNMASMAVGASGQLAIAWESPADTVGPANLLFSVNTAGISNLSAFTAEQVLTSTNVGGLHPLPAQPNRTVDAEPILAYDNSGGPNSGRLYFIYLTANAASGAGHAVTTLYEISSDDNGSIWSTPVRVNDGASGHSVFNPALSVDPTTGYVGISWYDTRNSSNNTNVQYWGTVSSDGGSTFAANFQISAGTSNSSGADTSSDPYGDLNFGDYSGLSFVNGRFVTAWSDNSNGTGNNPNGTLAQFNSYSDVTIVNAGAPVAADASYTTNEDEALTIPADSGLLVNDSAPANQSMTAGLVSNPSGGAVTLDSNGDGGFTYIPATGFVGTDTLTYAATDINGVISNTATVTLTVNAVAPTAVNDSYAVSENTTLTVAAGGVLANDTTPAGESIAAGLVSGPAHGTLNFDSNGDGGFVYTPSSGFTGTDSFTYTALAGNGLTSNTATVTLTVNAITAPPGANAAGSSIVYGSDGTLYMTWYDTVAGQLDFASRSSGGTWSSMQPIATLMPGAMMDIAVDGNNQPGIAYYDPGASALVYAHDNNGVWTYKTVDNTGRAGLYPNLIYNSANTPVIAYYDKATHSLKMAIVFKGQWTLATVDNNGDVGRYVNLHFNPQNNGYAVAFYDNTHGTVQYGYQFRSGWRFNTVDATTNGAVYLSLNYNQQQQEAIAYYSAGSNNLRYSWFNGTLWQTATVISTPGSGYYSTLLFDPNNNPDILYYNQNANAVFRAQGTPGDWSINELATPGGSYLAAAFAPNGTLSFSWLSDDLTGLAVTDL